VNIRFVFVGNNLKNILKT